MADHIPFGLPLRDKELTNYLRRSFQFYKDGSFFMYFKGIKVRKLDGRIKNSGDLCTVAYEDGYFVISTKSGKLDEHYVAKD